MSTTSTVLHPKYSPPDLAQCVIRRSTTPSMHSGIYLHQGVWYVYNEPLGRWDHYTPDEFMEDVLQPLLCTFKVEVHAQGQIVGTTPLRVTQQVVRETAFALTPLVRLPRSSTMPHRVTPNLPDPHNTITFQNALVTVVPTHERGEGEPSLKVTGRDSRWVESEVLPFDYNPNAACPTWLEALDDWAVKDPQHPDQTELWIDLLQRWFGYCLLPHNEYSRMLLMYGKVRAGKGTIARVLRAMFSVEGFTSTSLRNLASKYGLNNLLRSRVISINEVSSLKDEDAENASYALKSILGRDPVSMERKYLPTLSNVILPGKIMMQANQIPNLPNKGAGLSSKILMLPFDNSFLNREDHRLEDKLLDELPGIANWAIDGALKLVSSDGQSRWPTLLRSREAMDDYHTVNNPLDMFLRARFRPAKGWVRTEEVWRQFEGWQKTTGMRLHIPRNMLMVRLEQESSWDLIRGRKVDPLTGAKFRVLKGLLVKEKDDEI